MKRRSARTTSQTPLLRRSALLLTAAVAAATVGITGCQRFSPITTELQYAPADGVQTTLGDVEVRDLFVVSKAKGDPGVLSGYLVNNGGRKVTLQIQSPNADPVQATLPPHGTVKLYGGDAPASQLSTVNVAPGSMLDVQLKTPGYGVQDIQVPVLVPNGPYATITPTGGSSS